MYGHKQGESSVINIVEIVLSIIMDDILILPNCGVGCLEANSGCLC